MNVRHLHRKRMAWTVLLVLLLNVAGLTNVFAQQQFEADNLLYTIISTTPPAVSLDGHVDGTDFEEELYIPESVEYEGVAYTVTAISANAFADYSLMYGDLEIPSTVTTIGDYAFYNCSSLDGTLTIGESVTSIGSYAFANFFGMTSQLSIPNSVTQMGDHAFALGNFMGSLTISSSLTAIPDYAFQGCAYFSGDLLIPSSVTSIGSHAFDGCTSLNGKLQFPNPNTVTSIGDYAFYQCSNLTNMGTFSTNGITQIGDYAFYGCSHFTGQLSIYNTVTSIGDYAFYGCSGFTSINFNNSNPSLTSIGDYAFANCSGFIANLALPKSLQTIGDYAFYYCTGLNGNLTFRTGIPLSSIGAYAFSECSFKNTQGLVIPNTVTTMGDGAFAYCDDFTSTLSLGNGLTAIPDNAFKCCSFTGQLTIPASVTAIGENAFSGCTSFSGTLTIPENVTNIGSGAFYNCSGFTQLDYNAIVCTIATEGYYGWLGGCTSMTTLNFGENVQIIPSNAFMGREQFTGNLVIPGSVTEIGNYAFANCGFTGVTFNEGLTRISGYAFQNCTGITSIDLPESLTFLSGFYGCTGLTTVTIPEAVEGIGNSAFRNCTNLAEINFNATNCTTVNSQSGYGHWLEYCESLSTINIGENVQTIPDYAFYECETLTGDLVIPNAVTTIGNRAFCQCSGLDGSLTLGENVTSIGEYAFLYNNYTSVTCLAETPPTLGENVFSYGTLNIPVYVPCTTSNAYSSVSWGGFSSFTELCSGTITVAANPTEGGMVTGGGFYESGAICTVAATANAGYAFANWTINGIIVSTSATYTFPISGDATLIARFVTDGNIVFADANVKSICVANWDTNGDGELSYAEAATVSNLGSCFQSNTNITSFDELQYFIGLSSIGDEAFYGCSGLNSIVFPESISAIGNYTFANCSSLTGDLAFPNGVTSIGSQAFYQCTGLNGSLTIGENVEEIGYYAFAECSNITTLNYNAINSNANNDYYGWIEYCDNLHTLNIGENVEVIPNYAFKGHNVTFTNELVIPSSVISIGEGAFKENSFTGDLVIPSSVTSIADEVFYSAGFNGTLTIGEDVTAIGDNVFDHCGFTTLNYNAVNCTFNDNNNDWMNYCQALTTLNIGENVEVIPAYAFNNCSNITGSLVIPNAVTSIGEHAFDYCTGFNGTLTIGESVTSIGDNAFYYCWRFQSVTTLAEIPPTIGGNTFYGLTSKPLYIPCGTMDAYQSAQYWSSFTNMQYSGMSTEMVLDGLHYEIIDTENHYLKLTGFAAGTTSAENLVIPAYIESECDGYSYTVTEIAESSFNGANLTGTLVLPATVTTIGGWAFYNLGNLTGDLVIPENVLNIGAFAFAHCGFTSIHFNATDCQTMGALYTDNESNEIIQAPFYNNGSISEIVVGDNVTQIPQYAFARIYSDELVCELTIGNSVESIGDYAFYYTGLTGNLTIPNSVSTIGNYAFANYNGLMESLTMGNSVATIGDYAFYNCRGLTGDLDLPNTLLTIGNSAFNYSYRSAGTLTIPANVTKIGTEAFIYCGFTSIHYNATNCESIGLNDSGTWNFAFWNNMELQEIVIGDNVTQIPIYAFANTNAQQCSVDLGTSVTTINNYAFYNGSNNSTYSIKGALVIPASVTYIGYQAFYGCTGLTELWCKRSLSPTIQSNTFFNVNRSIPVHVPCGALSNYQNANYWSTFTNYMENPNVLVVRANDEYLGSASIMQYSSCSDNGSVVHAEAYMGGVFVNWTTTDGTVLSTDADYTFDLTEDIVLVANFDQLEGHHNFVGGYSNDWDDVENWVPQELPTATSSVGIWANAYVDVEDACVGDIAIYGNYELGVLPGGILTITGTTVVPSASQLVVYEDGQLIHSCEGVLASVRKIITRYTSDETKDGWHLISSPLADATPVNSINNLLSNEYDLYYYDEPTHYWMNQENEENEFNTLEQGTGYLYGNKGSIATTGYAPFNTFYNYSICECLFSAEELEQAGLGSNIPLTSLSWYATNSTGNQQNYITIWMANVSDEALTTTSHDAFAGNMACVFYGSITPTMGWNEFVFNESDSFSWDGTSNVLVCVQRNNQNWSSTINWRCHGTDFTAVSYAFTDNYSYGMNGRTYTMNTLAALRPDVIFRNASGDAQIGGDFTYPVTLAFNGELQNGSAMVNIPLSYTETAGRLKGFNLVGNPYAHNVTSYASTNVANGCYRMNEAKDDLIVSEISETDPLKPTEGFFVKATASDASITFNPQRGATMAKTNSIRVEVSKNNMLVDRLLVKTAECQPLEKFSLNEKHTKVFATHSQKELAIVPCEGNEQPFSFKAAKDGQYTINVDADGMEFTYLHLIDNKTGSFVDLLSEPSYTFDAKTTDYASRFRLVFATGTSVDGDNFSFFNANGNLCIFGIEGEATVQVIDMMGRVLSSETFSGSFERKINAAPGVYLVRLINGNDVRTQKVVVR